MVADINSTRDLTRIWAESARSLNEERVRQQMDHIPDRQEVDAIRDRGQIKTVVYSDDNGGGIPINIMAASLWIAQWIEKIPEKYRANARMTIDAHPDYEDADATLSVEIYYWRIETDEEWTTRTADVKRRIALHAQHQETRDRQEFERLRHKFGDKG